MNYKGKIGLIALGSAWLLTLGACGSNDESRADNKEACGAWIAADSGIIRFLFSGEGDADSVNASMDAAIAVASKDFERTLTELKSEAQPQLADRESDASPRTLELYSNAITWAGKNCDVEKFDVTAKEYMYEGIPTELSLGYHVVNFSNEGTEQHEMFAFKINDGVEQSAEELLAFPDDAGFSMITPVNAVGAKPGASSTISWDLTSPGRYAAVCFISQGSVGDTEGTGPPHFTYGMIHEFTVK